MWVYILISVVFAFLFGWAFSAEHHRQKQWRDEHGLGGGGREWHGPFVKPD